MVIFSLVLIRTSPVIGQQPACVQEQNWAELYVSGAFGYMDKVHELAVAYWQAKEANDDVAMTQTLNEMQNLPIKRDISDPIKILQYLFLGTGPSGPLEAYDFNRDKTADISDAVSLLRNLFLGDPLPDGADKQRLAQHPGETTHFTRNAGVNVKTEYLGRETKEDGKPYANFSITYTAQVLLPDGEGCDTGNLGGELFAFTSDITGYESYGGVSFTSSELDCNKKQITFFIPAHGINIIFNHPKQWICNNDPSIIYRFYNDDGHILLYDGSTDEAWVATLSSGGPIKKLTPLNNLALNKSLTGQRTAAIGSGFLKNFRDFLSSFVSLAFAQVEPPPLGINNTGTDLNMDGELDTLQDVIDNFDPDPPPSPSVPGPETNPPTPPQNDPPLKYPKPCPPPADGFWDKVGNALSNLWTAITSWDKPRSPCVHPGQPYGGFNP